MTGARRLVVERFTWLGLLCLVAACAHAQSSSIGSGGGDGGPVSAGGAGGAAGASAVVSGSGGAAGAESSAGSGGMTGGPCTPGETRECYDGADGTRDVGVCKAGVATCLPDGSAFGPCGGQVVPVLETCLTPIDDDCDGKTNEAGDACVCKPNASSYCYDGDPKTENVGACIGGVHTCNAEGTAWGLCEGQILPSVDGCLTPVDEDCDGKNPVCPATFSLQAGDAKTQLVHGVAAAVNGGFVLAGELEGTLAVGPLSLSSAGLSDAYVLKLDENGAPIWGFAFGDAGESQAALGVAVDASGDVLVTGYFRGTIAFGTTTLTSVGGADVFVAKLAGATGAPLWAVRFGNISDDQIGHAVTCDAFGNVFVTGAFAGTMTFNGVNATATGLQDGFVARLSGATGAAAWGRRFGGTDFDAGRDVVVDAKGDVLVVGEFFGAFSLGAKNLASAGLSDILFARFAGATGMPLDAARFGGKGLDAGRTLVVGPSGGPLIGGEFEGALDFGGGVLTSAGGFDVFLAELDPSGAHLQSRRFGGFGDESALALALDAAMSPVLAGYTTGSVDFGQGPVTSAGGRDLLIARLDSKLAGIWTRRFGDASFYQEARSVGLGPKGVFVGGHFSGKVTIDAATKTSAGATDALLLSFPD